jgi:WXG100 family type VII secretion target
MSSIFASDVLEFNTDTLNTQAKKIKKIADDLKKNQKKLTSSLETLREDWQTSAGDKFFEQYDEKWTHNLDNHIKLLNDLVKELQYAASQYEPVEREFSQLSF